LTRDELLNVHDMICSEAADLMRKKNMDYGSDGNVFLNFTMTEAMGLGTTVQGILIRMADKISRLRSFDERGELQNESARDAVIDIVNYAILVHAYKLQEQIAKAPCREPGAEQRTHVDVFDGLTPVQRPLRDRIEGAMISPPDNITKYTPSDDGPF